MVRFRFRFASMFALGLLALTSLAGCFGTPFDKGDNPGAGTGTGRPQWGQVDQGRTGGLGSPRGDITIGPGDLGPKAGSAPGVGAK